MPKEHFKRLALSLSLSCSHWRQCWDLLFWVRGRLWICSHISCDWNKMKCLRSECSFWPDKASPHFSNSDISAFRSIEDKGYQQILPQCRKSAVCPLKIANTWWYPIFLLKECLAYVCVCIQRERDKQKKMAIVTPNDSDIKRNMRSRRSTKGSENSPRRSGGWR